MKKLTYIFLATFMLLFPLTTWATSKVEFTELDNGVIDTKLHFIDGFIGGLDLSISISDKIRVEDVKFNKDFQNFTTTYEYDKNNQLLNIKIATGGIAQENNLLNSNKELNLGTIYLSTTSKEDVNYLLIPKDIKVINNSWNSVYYEDNFEIKGTNIFKLVVAQDNKPTDNDKEENEQTPTIKPSTPSVSDGENNNNNNNETTNQNDKEENKTETNKDNITQNNTQNTDNKNETNKVENNSNSNSSSNNTEIKDDNNSADNNSTNENDSNTNTNENATENKPSNNSSTKENKEDNSVITWLKVVLALIVLVTIIIYLVIRNKKVKK